MKKVRINDRISVGENEPLLVIAGPCQIESLDHSLSIASSLQETFAKLPVNFVFKSSFDKANRTSLSGARGIGIDEGLRILQEVKEQLGIPVITDIHSPEQVDAASEVVDLLQTPAFLCRQTDLLIAAGKSGLAINIKKGQFLHPLDMKFAAEKVSSTGNDRILLCERGTSFGYRDLVVDMRSLVQMKTIGYPVVFDATHSVQSMGGSDGSSGGSKHFVEPLAKAAVAVGVDGLFIECHENPSSAPSDGDSMLDLSSVGALIERLCLIRSAAS